MDSLLCSRVNENIWIVKSKFNKVDVSYQCFIIPQYINPNNECVLRATTAYVTLTVSNSSGKTYVEIINLMRQKLLNEFTANNEYIALCGISIPGIIAMWQNPTPFMRTKSVSTSNGFGFRGFDSVNMYMLTMGGSVSEHNIIRTSIANGSAVNLSSQTYTGNNWLMYIRKYVA